MPLPWPRQCCCCSLAASSTLVLDGRSPMDLSNTGDLSYYAELQLDGQTFRVLIDTGSADLWVAGSVSTSTDTGLRGSVTYALGAVHGPIKTALLRFGNYSVPAQAFLQVPPDGNHPEGVGILGLGPSTGSFITGALPSPAGSPMLYRLFQQFPTTPNFFTVLLGRDRDPDPVDHFPGRLTIGEVLPAHPIHNEPQLPIVRLPQSKEDDQHHQILLDSDGLIGPDGLPIPLTSVVPGVSDRSRLTVVLDTGFSLPQIPKSVADAIYGRFHGAEYVVVSGIGSTYILPCNAEVNVTFRFAGKNFPMHPLDMTIEPSALGLGPVENFDGELSCIATFQPFTYDRGASPIYDMVLGMAFMRNVYTLFDYGDYITPSNVSDTKPPYIQFIPLTDPSEAHTDFVDVRLGGVDVVPRPLTHWDPGSEGTDNNVNGGKSTKTNIAIVASVSITGALLIIVCFLFFRTRKGCIR